MRFPFFGVCVAMCGAFAFGGDEKESPAIATRPLSLADISRYSTRMRDPDNAKAIQAARELAETHQPNAGKLLLDFYTPGEGERRMAAVKALGVLADKAQGPALLQIALFDYLASVRRQAATELARLEGNDNALKRFTDAANDAKRYSPIARNRAVHYAAQIGGSRSGPFLRDMLNAPEFELNIAAAEELGELRETIAVDALLNGLNSDRAEIKPAVVAALERLTGKNFQFDLVKWSEWRKSVAGEVVSGNSAPVAGYKPADSSDQKWPVDFLICFDTTASFVHAWPEVDRAMDAVIKEIAKNELSPRIGLVRYRSVSPRATLKYSIWPSPLNWSYDAIRKELSVAAFGGGSGALHEGIRYALSGMAWRERSRKVILIIGDDTPYSPVEDAMKIVLQICHDAAAFDGIQINTLYTRTSAGEENRVTYQRIAAAGRGRFYEYNKAEKHLVDMGAEKIDVKKAELPVETAQKWLSAPKR